MIVLPHTNEKKAFEIGERIRTKVEKLATELHGTTLSVGIACCPHHTESIDLLVKIADEAVYFSKSNGKNTTILL